MISKPLNIIVLLFLLCSFVMSVFAQQKSGVYNWPLRPGMPEWKDLKTHDEMLEALKIPAKTLQKMTTKNLALTCLSYPLFSNI